MTIQELQEMRWGNLPANSGRPSTLMTDQQWQHRFELMRAITQISKNKKLTHMPDPRNLSGDRYCGDTMYHYFKIFINDVLEQIRLGHHEYCYYTYQIQELLKYENSRLMSKYHPQDQLWEVWLRR